MIVGTDWAGGAGKSEQKVFFVSEMFCGGFTELWLNNRWGSEYVSDAS